MLVALFLKITGANVPIAPVPNGPLLLSRVAHKGYLAGPGLTTRGGGHNLLPLVEIGLTVWPKTCDRPV